MNGYNNWRIPTNEELSLMRANNYLGTGEYMTKESKHGIVLLVSDGKDYKTILAEEAEERERQRLAEEKRIADERRKAEELERQKLAEKKIKFAGVYIDLGLPSGTLWRSKNVRGFYTYDEAVSEFGSRLPTKEQFEELMKSCTWTWTGSGYKVVGPSGESIFLPADGGRECDGSVDSVVSNVFNGNYWSSTSDGSGGAWYLLFISGSRCMSDTYQCSWLSVRLVQD